MKIKKLSIYLLCVILAFGMTACRNDGQTGDNGKPVTFADTNIVLAENGSTQYKTVVPQNASEAILFAAQELNEFFAKATGANLVTEEETNVSDSDKVIALGETKFKKSKNLSTSEKELTGDGYKIERYDNAVVICGGSDSGTAYGVYEFMKYHFGFEVYAVDEIKVEKKEKLLLKNIHLTDVPDFEGRMVDGKNVFDAVGSYRLRTRMWNSSSPSLDYGAGKDFIGGHCHSFFSYLPREVYKQDHPEWYKENDKGGTLCLSNAELRTEFVKNAIKALQDNPDSPYMNISEEDGYLWCDCADCLAEQNRYTTSGYLIRFCNYVIGECEKWIAEHQPGREIKYLTFAYSTGSISPPVREDGKGGYTAVDASVVPHRKLYIRFAPLDYCYSHALTDTSCEKNKVTAQYLAGWKAITNRFMIWDYDVSYHNFFMFFNFYDALQTNLKNYKEMGVVNIMRQDTSGGEVSSMDDLKLYLNTKLMWDTDADVNELIDDFMDNFYKDGAPYMKEYFSSVRAYLKNKDLAAERGLHFCVYDYLSPTLPTSQVWSKRILEQSLELFDKAFAAYEKLEDRELAEKLRLRVLRESYCVRYLLLKNYAAYYNIDEAYYNAVDEFERDTAVLGANTFREGQVTSEFINMLRR